MKKIRDWRMAIDEKHFATPRVLYRTGYSGFFTKQVNPMLQKGLTADELLGACIDAKMKRWVECVAKRMAITEHQLFLLSSAYNQV